MPECSLGPVKIHVEVPIFLLFFVFMFESSVTTNLIIYRTCYVTLGFNETQCALLGTNYSDNATAALEEKVQPHAAVILMTRSLSLAIVPPFLCFFLGPWSDKNGRKPVMLLTLAGFILSYIIMVTLSALPRLSPWFFVMADLPTFVTGGFPSLFTVLLSYIADVTSEENRGVRMGFFEAAMTVGSIIGTLSSSFVLVAYGYESIYIISALAIFFAWFFTLFFIPESIEFVGSQEGKFRDLFKMSLLTETFKTTFRKRQNYDRVILLSLIGLLVIYMLACLADSGVIFLYLRERFHWSLEIFTFYSSMKSLTWIIGTILGAFVMNKLLHVEEIWIILVGLSSNLCGSLFLGLAQQSWQVYAAGGSRLISGAVGPMTRSLVSKIIPTEESGKIFSVVTSLETVGALAGSPIYTFIYNNTIDTFPQAFNFVTAGIFLCQILIAIVVKVLLKCREQIQYRDMINEDSNEPTNISANC